MGTADLACASLRALASHPGLTVVAAVTQPDRPKGRKLQLHPSPVKAAAQALGLPVLQPEKARAPGFLEELKSLRPDLCVVAAYGQILPQALLDIPSLGCLNIHTSLLPKYRGAAPIQWAILEGETETGVTIMRMDAGLDTGPLLAQRRTAITKEDDAMALHDRLSRMGAELLIETIPDYASGEIVPQPQPAKGSSYARKIKKEDGLLDWSRPAHSLWNRVRGLVPWPGAYTHWTRDAKSVVLKLWKAEMADGNGGSPGQVRAVGERGIDVVCGEGNLRILELQLEGGRRMPAQAFLAGHALLVGDKLGETITPDNVR